MKNGSWCLKTLLCFLCYLISTCPLFSQTTSSPQAKGIFFFKPDCPQCERLQRDILPDIKKQFGDQISILSLNTTHKKGGQLYLNAIVDLGIPFSQSLPIVIFGDQFWSDPAEITSQLPTKVSSWLNGSGSEWPAVSGLKSFLNSVDHLPESEIKQFFVSANPGTLQFILSDMGEKFKHDPLGNGYGVVVLISMIFVVGYSVFLFVRSSSLEIDFFSQWLILILSILGIAVTWQLAEVDLLVQSQKPFWSTFESQLAILVLAGMVTAFGFSLWALFGSTARKIAFWQRWMIPLLLAIGFAAAGYLTYVDASNAEAVCGAVGDCNTVQQSEYSSLFGIISVGVLGLLGHLLLLITWGLGQFGPIKWQGRFRLLLWGILQIGVCFFIFLTFLEPFVIGATCFWCITTAMAMTLQLFVSLMPAIKAKKSLYPK